MTSRVEEAANTTREQLCPGTPANTAFSYLTNESFSDESVALDTTYGGEAFLFQKQIILKRWWGGRDAHYIHVSFKIDTGKKVADTQVWISWGGVRGL